MRRVLFVAAATAALAAGAAQAATVKDAVGDLLPTFAGDPSHPNLDITSFSVDFDAAADGGAGAFDLVASFAGSVVERNGTQFVIGVNTGTGANHPFANIGEANIAFNTAFAVMQNGSATVNGHSLTADVSGDSFSLVLPVDDLISTGAKPQDFTFALWTKDPTATPSALGGNSLNADFAPDNRMLGAVPEPASWALMITGFGLAGAAMRLQRTGKRRAASA